MLLLLTGLINCVESRRTASARPCGGSRGDASVRRVFVATTRADLEEEAAVWVEVVGRNGCDIKSKLNPPKHK